jgi:hypothetical protein
LLIIIIIIIIAGLCPIGANIPILAMTCWQTVPCTQSLVTILTELTRLKKETYAYTEVT